MKSEYKKPIITVEALESNDVLLSSGVVDPTETTDPVLSNKKERENRYGDFISFMFGGPGSWF